MSNTPKDDSDPPIVVIINRVKAAAKKFIVENPKTVTFLAGVLTGCVLVWLL